MGRKKRRRGKFKRNSWAEIRKILPRRHSLSPLGYVRVNIKYPIHFVFANVGHHRLTLAGHEVKMWSKRYQNFVRNGIECVRCGLKGKYFRLECNAGDYQKCTTWHFNLYALDGDGNEVLMTKDHIIPKSKGGSNSLRNFQTMCSACNAQKADKLNPWDLQEGEFK
jgi:5-methylcytosine-specific restriction endonuclease McrA